MFSLSDINQTFSQMLSLDSLQSTSEQTAQPDNGSAVCNDPRPSSPSQEGDAAQAGTAYMDLELAKEIISLRESVKLKDGENAKLIAEVESMKNALASKPEVGSNSSEDTLDQLKASLAEALAENGQLKMRIDSLSISLNSTTENECMTGDSSETMALRSQCQQLEVERNQAIASQRQIEEQLARHRKEDQEKHGQLEHRLKELKSETDSRESVLRAEIAYLTKQLDASNNSVVEKENLWRDVQALQAATSANLSTAEESISKLQLSFRAKEAELDGERSSSAALADDFRQQLAAKESTIADFHSKTTALTEKLKDVMKKYAELKAKNQAHEGVEERAADLLKQLQAKDSELLSIKLKFENLERNAGDSKVSLQESSEKLNDAQREILKLRAKVHEDTHFIATLNKDTEDTKVALEASRLECSDLTIQLVTLREQCNSMERANEIEKERLIAELNEQIEKLTQQVDQLESENHFLQNRAKADDEMANTLEEYKKRAQNALKKANSASATIVAEKAEMQKLVDEASNRAMLTEETLRATKTELDRLLERAQQAESGVDLLTTEVENLRKEREELIQASLSSFGQASMATYNGDEGGTREMIVALLDNGTANDNNNARFNPSPLTAPSDVTSISPKLDLDESPFAFPHRGAPPSTNDEPTVGKVEIEEGISLQIEKPSSEHLIYINELHAQLEELRKESSQRTIQIEQVEQELQAEREGKKKLACRVNDLMAFLERTKKLHEGPEAAINMEYLKNCIYKFMSSTEFSEKKRLYPVIAMILKLTPEEKQTIEYAMATEDTTTEIAGLGSISSLATSSLGSISSFFGGGGT